MFILIFFMNKPKVFALYLIGLLLYLGLYFFIEPKFSPIIPISQFFQSPFYPLYPLFMWFCYSFLFFVGIVNYYVLKNPKPIMINGIDLSFTKTTIKNFLYLFIFSSAAIALSMIVYNLMKYKYSWYSCIFSGFFAANLPIYCLFCILYPLSRSWLKAKVVNAVLKEKGNMKNMSINEFYEDVRVIFKQYILES